MSRKSPFNAISPKVDLPALDRRIIAWWKQNDVFNRSVAQTAGGPRWTFYEGPPTANGAPGTHHVEARVFKDIFPRFKTMKGYSVPRRAGWDCHGLAVELAVEKELGLSGKPDIERMGIAEFNAHCRESVQRHVGEFEALTERMGYWVDMANPYSTMSPEYIDSVWWALRKIFTDGRLVEDYRVAPYCPRCGTTLSDHEVAQGYETVTDPSVYVRFPVIGQLAGHHDVELLIWTTTPWTLVANTAIAVHPDVTYVIARTDRGTFVVAEPLATAVLGDGAQVLGTLSGTELVGVAYQRPFNFVDIPNAHYVVAATYVTTEDGTGLVHQAPAFGADDLIVCRQNNLPVVNPIAGNGHFLDDVPLVGTMFFKAADAVLIDELEKSGRLFRELSYEHPYPHCWRCHTPLMYYAQQVWYIRTTAISEQLQRENERTNWYPDHIKHGRYGNWLNNNVDWALSRSRYWGTPLPLWRCGQNHVTPVGSRAELATLSGTDLANLDPHRPFIDDVVFACPDCGDQSRRVPEVIDAWFDSGSMPFGQIGYPHLPGSEEEFTDSYPAAYICEAIDQTRGWFYTLMAVGTLVFDRSSYENVVCLGHIMAEDGRKMSKHLGNILAPIPLMEQHGADALRWFMLCSGSPWSPRRVGNTPLDEITRKLLLTYWNTASFFSLYAGLAQWAPEQAAPAAQRPLLDRWIMSELHQLAATVDDRLEHYDVGTAGRALAVFVDDLSNWYVRRSRQRFWDGDHNALVTLHTCLDVLTRLLAPFVPFITEQVWADVVRPGLPVEQAAESVHLASWPQADMSLVDASMAEQMGLARQLAEAGRAARKGSNIPIRQPLGRALIGLPAGVEQLPAAFLVEVAEELNVGGFEPLHTAGEVVDVSVKPNFRLLGQRFGNRTQLVAAAIGKQSAVALAQALKEGGHVTIELDGEQIELSAQEVIVSEVPRSGWVIEKHHDVIVALDITITPELRSAGLAREIIRFVQNARKDAGLEVSDRIELHWQTSANTGDTGDGDTGDEVRRSLLAHRDDIAATVLATSVHEMAPDTTYSDSGIDSDSARFESPELGLTIRLIRHAQ